MPDLFDRSEIDFDAATHIYKDKKGRRLLSVSQLLGNYKPPFDPDGSILRKCAAKKGLTPEVLKAEWEKIKNDACERGTNFHSQAEEFIRTGKIPDGPDKDIIERFSKIKFAGELHTEQIVYSTEELIAGTFDLAEVVAKNRLNLYDFKTNKKLDKYSIFGNRMLYPIGHIYECNFNFYSLQLSLYAYLIEAKGFLVDNLAIFYINPRTREVETHPVKYLRDDIVKVLNHYKGKGVPAAYDPFASLGRKKS